MKKRLRILTVFMVVVMICSAISATSVVATKKGDYPRSNDVYMNGYKMYGYSTLVPLYVSSATFCENLSYQKRVIMNYAYTNLVGTPYAVYGGDTGYVTYGFDTIDFTITADGTRTFTGVLGYHYVKASAHMVWDAFEAEECTHLGVCSDMVPQ